MSVVDDSHVNADVASGGIRVGAHLVGLVSELLSLIVRQSRDNDLQHDGEAEPLPGLTDRDPRSHRGVAEALLRLASHHLQGGVEACGITSRKQLLRVRTLTATTHRDGNSQILRHEAVGALDVTIAARTGGNGLSGVDRLDLDHGFSLLTRRMRAATSVVQLHKEP